MKDYSCLNFRAKGVPFRMVEEVRSMSKEDWAYELQIWREDSKRGDQRGRRCLKVGDNRIEFLDGGSSEFIKEENGRVIYKRTFVELTKVCPHCHRKYVTQNGSISDGRSCGRPKCTLNAMRESL